eukprot:g618.t1
MLALLVGGHGDGDGDDHGDRNGDRNGGGGGSDDADGEHRVRAALKAVADADVVFVRFDFVGVGGEHMIDGLADTDAADTDAIDNTGTGTGTDIDTGTGAGAGAATGAGTGASSSTSSSLLRLHLRRELTYLRGLKRFGGWCFHPVRSFRLSTRHECHTALSAAAAAEEEEAAAKKKKEARARA